MSVNIFKNGILSKIAGAVGDAVPLINNFLTNQEGKGAADANTVYVLNNKIEEVNSSLTANNAQKFQFAYDAESGKYGYMVKEADTDVFVPFSSGNVGFKYVFRPNTTSGYINGGNVTFEFDFEPKEFIFVITEYSNGFVRVPLNCEFGEALNNPFLRHVSHDDLQITVNDTYIMAGGNYVYCFYK